MTADAPSHLVPKLRFPEFGNMPGWELTQLSDVLDYEQPGKYIVEDSNYQSAGTPVLTANKGFVLGHTAETDGIYQHVPVIIFDDFTTDAKYVDFPFKVKSSAIKILTSRGEDELRLVYELMSRIRFDSTQHKRYFISQYQYLKIPLPGKSEQQKITDCLGSLDDLIAAEGQKLDALRQHKQGLMQQLFPQPGETVPRLRFPKFEHAPKWEEERLGNLVVIVSGKSPSQYALVAQGDCAFVKVEDLNNCSKYQVDGREYCNDVRDAVPSGSILFPKRGAAIENNKIRITASEILIDTNLMALTPRNTAATEFLYYYLVRVGLAQIADTSSIPQINNKHIIPYRVLVPSESEQHRIADCLSMLDARLTAQVQKLDALQTHKQGLLQQLFPSLDEQ